MKKSSLLLLALFATCITYAQCWQSVSASFRNTYAIQNDGTLWAWGRNTYGQLGDGTNINKSRQTQMKSTKAWAENCDR